MSGHVAVIDYDMGNVGAVINMLRKIGATGLLTRDHDEIREAKALILPGVGSFDRGMKNLERYGLRELLADVALRQKLPILGICLGMQLMTDSSEEGQAAGLGWLEANTVRFVPSSGAQKIPHMGWNTVNLQRACPLFAEMEEKPRFYFAHSFYVACGRKELVAGTTDYGCRFASVVMQENLFGVQFHPEKSHRYGLVLLKSFLSSLVTASC